MPLIRFSEGTEAEGIAMQIQLPNDRGYESLATAAGFASVEDYVVRLLEREAERRAIQEGIDAMRAGDMQPLDEVDAELRREFGFSPRT